MKKQILASLTAFSLMAGTLAGCSGQTTNTTGSADQTGNQTIQMADASEVNGTIDIRIVLWVVKW